MMDHATRGGEGMTRRLWQLPSLIGLISGLIISAAIVPVSAEPTSRLVQVGVKGKMEATLYDPDGPGPFASVIVIHTSQGLIEVDRQFCASLAREGFRCIVPAFLRAYGIRQDMKEAAFTSDREAILADFRQIVGMMDGLPGARPGAVGAVGFSNGGLFAVLLAAQKSVKAGVAYYGALMGVGQPLANNPFRQSFTSASSPVLVLMGENDTTMGPPPVKMLEEIMKTAGARYTIKYYPDAEHGFDRNNLRPGNEAAKNDAWPRTLAFLRQHVQ
jgi:carboxymethylenebutenolidase